MFDSCRVGGRLGVLAEPPPALLPLFRSRNQLALLAELFIHAGTERPLSELARATGISKSVISHEMDRLVDANRALPYFAELQSMLLKNDGPATRNREALEGLAIYRSTGARARHRDRSRGRVGDRSPPHAVSR